MYDLSYDSPDSANPHTLVDMFITRRCDHKVIRLAMGSKFWRIAHFIGHRENKECCDITSPEIPADVQWDILGMCFTAIEKGL